MGCAASCTNISDGSDASDDSLQVWVPEQWFVKYSHGRLVTRRIDRTDAVNSDDDLDASTSVRGSSTAGFVSLNAGPSQSDSTGDDFDPLASDIVWGHRVGGPDGSSNGCLSDFSSDGRLTDEPSRPYLAIRESACVLRARLSHGITGDLDQFDPLPEPHEFVRLSFRRVHDWWIHCGLGERQLGRSPPATSEEPRRSSRHTTGSLENSPRGTAVAVRRRRRVAVTTDALELHDRLTSWPNTADNSN